MVDATWAARAKRAIEYAKVIPTTCQAIFIRAVKKETSPRTAIKANCQQCMGYSDFRNRIRDCDSATCPLWAFRPYQVKKKIEN